MAPSTCDSTTRVRKQYATIPNYTRVTKIQSIKTGPKPHSAQKLQALSNIINEEKARLAAPLKRKREDEDQEGAAAETEYIPSRKSLLFPGPPTSAWADDDKTPLPKRTRRKTPTYIPDPISDLRDIFKYFLKAFSIYRAHNGNGNHAGLDTLLPTITRLYKKRSITREDIQRVFALFEVPVKSVSPTKVILQQHDSPFKLVVSGVGAHTTYLVDYCMGIPYNEKFLIQDYEDAIETCCIAGRNKPYSFIHAPVEQYPLLAYETTAQTAARQEKASAVRDHVLGGAPQRQQKVETAEPDFKRLSLAESDSIDLTLPSPALPSTKSRTALLFDRVKAKQSAASLLSAPTSAELLRRHAIGRIGDIVEILRMKQTQNNSTAILDATPSRDKKVSLSMPQVMNLIKSSLSIPVASEEIKMCVNILANEIPGTWLKIIEIGNFQSVIIQGKGWRGNEVKAILQSRA